MNEFSRLSRNQFWLQIPAEKIFLCFQLIRPSVRKVPPSYAAAGPVWELLGFATRGRRP